MTKEFLLLRYKTSSTTDYFKISDDQNSGASGLLNNTIPNKNEIENLEIAFINKQNEYFQNLDTSKDFYITIKKVPDSESGYIGFVVSLALIFGFGLIGTLIFYLYKLSLYQKNLR